MSAIRILLPIENVPEKMSTISRNAIPFNPEMHLLKMSLRVQNEITYQNNGKRIRLKNL